MDPTEMATYMVFYATKSSDLSGRKCFDTKAIKDRLRTEFSEKREAS